MVEDLPLRAEPFDDRATRPFFAGLLPEGDKRKLIAQDELPVVADGARIGLPLFRWRSTHVLKPPIAAVDGSVFNEGYCMALASACKRDLAKATIQRVVGRSWY